MVVEVAVLRGDQLGSDGGGSGALIVSKAEGGGAPRGGT
jgi:hypothetical protein